MVRVRWDLPWNARTVITSRDSVKNIIDTNLTKRGFQKDKHQPAQYGFGVIAKRVPANRRMYQVQRVWVGSSNVEIAQMLMDITAEDLLEPNMVEGAGLDLRQAKIHISTEWEPYEAVAGYAVSPIRLVRTDRQKSDLAGITTFGPQFNDALNKTMERRFGRKFQLQFIPDSAYVRLHGGKVAARMAIKVLENGKVIAPEGVVLPFTLTGPPSDIRDAWFSGLGSGTAKGFGWWEMDDTWN